MSLHLYRHQKVELLDAALAANLVRTRPRDPLASIALVVGSRGMERHLRHSLATASGVAMQLEFLFPEHAFRTAAAALLDDAREIPWKASEVTADVWRGPALVFRVVEALRHLRTNPDFAAVGAYLGDSGAVVGPRELRFAEDVAGSVERMLADRPDDALAWAENPAVAPESERWLARLLRTLEMGTTESPASLLARLERLPPQRRDEVLHVFGLSTMRPGDKRRLTALARHLDVHLYALAPSREWIADLKSPAGLQRELREAKDAAAVDALLERLGADNELLAADAGPSRDLQGWLELTGYEETDLGDGDDDHASSLLTLLQSWVDEAGENPNDTTGAWAEALAQEDGGTRGIASVEIHRSHGELRQCEVLRDALVRRFAADKTLEPRHVLVMTPDLATYGPLLSAVLERAPALPAQLHDLGLKATNPLAELALELIRLSWDRVNASDLLWFAGRRHVSARFGLSDDDVARLLNEVRESGLRWGWDEGDRTRHEQPALHANTVAFGLERMALGTLMALDEPHGVVTAPLGEPGVPLDVVGGEQALRFGRFSRLCRLVERLSTGLRASRGAAAWRDTLTDAVDALTVFESEDGYLRTRFVEGLGEALDAYTSLPIDAAALHAFLTASFELPMRGASGTRGAIQVTGLEPLRSIPFRVVALVGMDDGAFPRHAQQPTWDPFARARPGEHARSVVDRHLFLEALLCARDAFVVIGRGFDADGNEAVPMSVVVEELQQLLGRGVAQEALVRHGVVRSHPLQPWSLASFDGAATATVDKRWHSTAGILQRAESGTAKESLDVGLSSSRPGASWPPDDKSDDAVSADAIARALAKPQRELLGRRLRLGLEPDEVDLPEREPIESGSLQGWALRRRMLDGLSESASEAAVGDWTRRFAGEGVLPIRAGGEREVADRYAEAREVISKAAGLSQPGRGERRVLACIVGATRVEALAGDVRRDASGRDVLIVPSASKAPGDEDLLRGLLTLLVARASGDRLGDGLAHAVGFQRAVTLALPEGVEAPELLSLYLALYREVRAGPVWLFHRLSHAVAESLAEGKDARASLEQAQTAWDGSPFAPGIADDAWVKALYGHLDFDDLCDEADSIAAVARRSWAPVLAAIDAGEALVT